ncbi:MAG: hypothetical protein VX438_13800, partial [Planctomycetota bacterium]|nr:hypothetical protein [Planctomycetota bacterium]
FFKSWAHPGSDGKMHSSPLLLAKNFDWFKGQRLESVAKEKASEDSFPSWAIIAIPIIIAISVSGGVYVASIWNNDDSRKRSNRNSVGNQLSLLNDDEIGPSVLESLGKLATEDLPEVKADKPEESKQEAILINQMEATAKDGEESSDNA